jgi:hypothetical protein
MIRRTLVAAALAAAAILPVTGDVDAVRICRGWVSATAASNQCWDDSLIRIWYRTRLVCSHGSVTIDGPAQRSYLSGYGAHSRAICPVGLYRTSSWVVSWR